MTKEAPLSEAARKAAVEIESELELHPPLSHQRRDKIAAVIDSHFVRPGPAAERDSRLALIREMREALEIVSKCATFQLCQVCRTLKESVITAADAVLKGEGK